MKKGFTLIELLVVMVMVGLLVTIALPKYKTAMEKGRAMEAIANAAAISEALNAYYVLNYNSYVNTDSATAYVTKVAAQTATSGKENSAFSAPEITVISTDKAKVSIKRSVTGDKYYEIRFTNENGELSERACLATAESTGEKYCKSLGANTAVTGGWKFAD